MRPLHLVYAIDSLGSGGAQRQVVELAVRLGARPDLRVSVLVYRVKDFFGDRLRSAGIEIIHLHKRWKLDPLHPRRVRRWVRAHQVDVVHAFMLSPALWNWLGVRGLHGSERPVFLAAERNSRIATTRLEGALQRLVYRAADAVTANSRVAQEEIRTKLGLPPERVHYLCNGIDLEGWDRALREPPPFTLEPDRFNVALVGRLEPQKNHALLLAALSRLGPARIGNWRVWFVGAANGGSRHADEIRAEIRERGLEEIIRILPPTPGVAALMSRLDLLVLPSRYEGFPNVVLEALAARLPVVAARVGDVPELIEHGKTGFVFPPGDAAALTDLLSHVSQLPEGERRHLAARGRATVESRYRIEAVALAHLELYRSLLRRQRRGSVECAAGR